MTPVRMAMRIGSLALVWAGLSAPVLSLDKIGQKGVPATQLGQRIAEQSAPAEQDPGTAAYWQAVAEAIAASDPAKDARADTRSGNAGLMTYANDSIAERYVASGLRCSDRSEPRRRTVFHFGYQSPLTRDAGQALLAFDAYARIYNAKTLGDGALAETSCILVED